MSDTPVVIAAPGMTLAEVVRLSTAQIGAPTRTAGLRVAQALQVHRFTVPHSDHAITLDPGLFGLLELRDGVVESVRISPHIEYLQGSACVTTLDACATTLNTAGWQREGSYSGEQAQARATHGGTALAGVWVIDRWRARLTLRRVHDAGSAAGRLLGLQGDAFVATLQVVNARLSPS